MTLKEVNLAGRIRQAGGASLKQAGEFFGWKARSVTKTAADFTKEQLLAKGWSKERLLDVAEGYELIAGITPQNPSAAGRAAQLARLQSCLIEGDRPMSHHNRFMIHNDLSGPVVLNIEPESVQFPLASGDQVTVWDTFEREPVTLQLESDKGDTIISVWPGDGQVRVEKDGVDVFDLIQS